MGGCNNAGLVHQNGYQDKPPDHEKALELFSKSCEGGFKNGCFNTSVVYLQGRDDVVEKNMKKALDYSLKSCELGHPWGCANASRILRLGDGGIEKDAERAKKLLEKAKKLSKPNWEKKRERKKENIIFIQELPHKIVKFLSFVWYFVLISS